MISRNLNYVLNIISEKRGFLLTKCIPSQASQTLMFNETKVLGYEIKGTHWQRILSFIQYVCWSTIQTNLYSHSFTQSSTAGTGQIILSFLKPFFQIALKVYALLTMLHPSQMWIFELFQFFSNICFTTMFKHLLFELFVFSNFYFAIMLAKLLFVLQLC